MSKVRFYLISKVHFPAQKVGFTCKIALLVTAALLQRTALHAQPVSGDGAGTNAAAVQQRVSGSALPPAGGPPTPEAQSTPSGAVTPGGTGAPGTPPAAPSKAAPAVRLQQTSEAPAVKYYKGKGPGRDNRYLNRNEEDYSYLRDPAKSTDPFDRLKYIPLDSSGNSYVTFSGEARLRFDDSQHNNLNIARGETTAGKLSFASNSGSRNLYFQRYQLGADVHLSPYAEVYAEAIHAQDTGSAAVKSYPGISRNDIAFSQAFIQLMDNDNLTHFGVRAGRQNLALGNLLMLQPTYTLNIPSQNYDMVRAWADWGVGRIDAFYGNEVNYFNDTAIFPTAGAEDNPKNKVWGIYSSFDLPTMRVLNQPAASTIEPFYIGYQNRLGTLDQTAYYSRNLVLGKNMTAAAFSDIITQPTDLRSTFGLRYFGTLGTADYDWQAAYQTGNYGSYGVSAWALNTDTGYNFSNVLFNPRVGVRVNAASGGGSGLGINTFQAIQANTSYYAENNAIAPANIWNVAPRITARFSPKLAVSVYDSIFWRYSVTDAVYSGLWEGGGGVNAYSTTVFNKSSYVGHQPAISFDYRPIAHVSFSGQLADFIVGDALKKAGARDTYYLRLFASVSF